MKVCGFTIVRNAINFDYPVVESIQSILPICDEFVVAVGNSDDKTLELIRNISSPKIKIIESKWDDSLREGGRVLAVETDKCMDAISDEFDWLFYLQADELVHEKYLSAIKKAMQEFLPEKKVEGLLFNYLHFFGSYDFVGNARRWYRREIRVIRNDKKIRAYRDAQGFRNDGRKLNVKLIDAAIYHYGWVKNPLSQQLKQKNFQRLWHSDEIVQTRIQPGEEYNYSSGSRLQKFGDSHPAVMCNRIKKMNWDFNYEESNVHISTREKILNDIEKFTGFRVGEYRNYKII
jgi:glycosyltransferase involved in cell wall biosynthesis